MSSEIINWTRTVLGTTPERFLQFTKSFPSELLYRQPKEGEWSAMECLLHLVVIEAVFVSRAKAIAAGEPQFPAYDPDSEQRTLDREQPATALAEEFAKIRAETMLFYDTITADALENTSSHSELGTVTLSNLLHEWGGHDLMHTVQAEQAMMQPFIAGCGAWQPFFANHVAK